MDLPYLIVVYSISFSIFACVVFLKTRVQAIVHLVAFTAFMYVAEMVPIFIKDFETISAEVFVDIVVTIVELFVSAALVPFLLHWVTRRTGDTVITPTIMTRAMKAISIGFVAGLYVTGTVISLHFPLPGVMVELPLSLSLFVAILVHLVLTKDIVSKFIDLNLVKMVLYPFLATNLQNAFPLVIITMILVNVGFVVVIMAEFNATRSLVSTGWEAGEAR